MEVAMRLDMEIHDGESEFQEETEHIGSLVQEFFAVPPSPNCGGDVRVLERWFSELGVEWVLDLPLSDDEDAPAAAAAARNFDARSWIRALAEIVRTIRSTASLLFPPDRGSMSTGLPIISEEGQAQAVADDQFLLRRVTNNLFRRVANKLFRTNSVSVPRGCEEEPEALRVPDRVQLLVTAFPGRTGRGTGTWNAVRRFSTLGGTMSTQLQHVPNSFGS
jgi:hypothetical protein